jgi:hypothetical protein
MLIGAATVPVTRTIGNEPKAIERLHGKLERDSPSAGRVCYEAGPSSNSTAVIPASRAPSRHRLPEDRSHGNARDRDGPE